LHATSHIQNSCPTYKSKIMKPKLSLIITFLTFTFQSFGQINPVENLTWSHWYDTPNNYFRLEWEEPESPHDQIIGYNIYRENDLYIFVNETSIYNIGPPVHPANYSNCGGEDFFFYGDGDGFTAFVTAVYSGQIESNAETANIDGPLLSTNKFKRNEIKIYPNPTDGIVNIKSENLKKIKVFTLNGKIIKEYNPKNQIDLSEISKGIYIIKLISESGVLTDKIIIK